METLEFKIEIKAPKEKVWKILWEDKTYREWTSVFCEGTYAVSNWQEGDSIQFLSPDGSGMNSVIVKRVENEYMAFKHLSEIKKFKDMPADGNSPKLSGEDANRVMHVSLPIGQSVLMGSDSNSASGDVTFGGNFSVSVNVESAAEADRIFNGLSAGGNPHMPMSKTFWGAYFGMFTDEFGVNWMVNFDENQKK